MEKLSAPRAIRRMNRWGKYRQPFFFVINFKASEALLSPLEDLDPRQVQFQLPLGFRLETEPVSHMDPSETVFDSIPVPFQRYQPAFQQVQEALLMGNTYLLNLAFPARVITNLSLLEIYQRSTAPYRLWMNDRFVVNSPEAFVRIQDGVISTFPMKGTIAATTPNAADLLLENAKEQAEHATIVDLLRNDLGRVCERVWVAKYRYIERISTSRGDLLQTSTHISGQLPSNYEESIGDLLFELLPAGSVSGAPKNKTLEVIGEAEGYDRGYYTGIFGVFDGQSLDSGVMIRFLEKGPEGLIFKSGGGITAMSKVEEEYAELKQKIYLPFLLKPKHAAGIH